MRLLTLHNLTYLERLVAGAREAIRGRAASRAYRDGVLAGRGAVGGRRGSRHRHRRRAAGSLRVLAG